jgi:hypothetical protein
MSARPLPAIGSTGRKASIAFAANLLVTVVLAREHFKRGLNKSTAEASEGDMRQIGIPVGGKARTEERDEVSIPSGCCSHSVFYHPRVACQRK